MSIDLDTSRLVTLAKAGMLGFRSWPRCLRWVFLDGRRVPLVHSRPQYTDSKVVCPTSIPGLSSSPWIRGAPVRVCHTHLSQRECELSHVPSISPVIELNRCHVTSAACAQRLWRAPEFRGNASFEVENSMSKLQVSIAPNSDASVPANVGHVFVNAIYTRAPSLR